MDLRVGCVEWCSLEEKRGKGSYTEVSCPYQSLGYWKLRPAGRQHCHQGVILAMLSLCVIYLGVNLPDPDIQPDGQVWKARGELEQGYWSICYRQISGVHLVGPWANRRGDHQVACFSRQTVLLHHGKEREAEKIYVGDGG